MATKRKKFAVEGSAGPNSDINMTPLVDVVLVLLIIFMVVTPLLEKDIEVKVPEITEEDDPLDTPPDQLVVSISKDGEIKINTDVVSAEEYVPRLKRVVAAKPLDEKLVFFMADEETNYGTLIAALDGARQAGAKMLGMMTTKIDVATGALETPADGTATPTP